MADRDAAVARIRSVPGAAATVAVLLGTALLEGYVYNFVPLVPTALFLPPAQPLDAVLFVLAGAALLGLRVRSVRMQVICAVLTVTIAALTLLEYLVPIHLRLDALLFPDQTDQLIRIFPGRPAPLAGITFLLLGLVMAVDDPVRRRPGPVTRHCRTSTC
jgi:hypothetical protein